MKRNTYTVEVNDTIIENFEFIIGPMLGINISPPPFKPEAFIESCFNGGATPIGGCKSLEVDENIQLTREMVRGMEDKYFGINLLCLWKNAAEFLHKFNQLGDESPGFIDFNAIEMVFEDFIPLIKDIKVPIHIGIHHPISIYTFKKHLLKKENSFLLDRIASKTLTLYLPRNVGGGHLPAITRRQLETNGLDDLLRELCAIEEEIKMPIPFIVEKGMMNVSDFTDVITEYSHYPSFTGVRFASNMLLSNETALNPALRSLIKDIISRQDADMIIPIRSQLAAVRKGTKVRGGVLTHVVATKIMKKLHEIQCEGQDFPKMSRSYNPEILKHQAETTNSVQKKQCKNCHKDCAQEICGVQLSWHTLEKEGILDESTLTLSPKILQLDPDYIDAPAEYIVDDIITKTLAALKHENVKPNDTDNFFSKTLSL